MYTKMKKYYSSRRLGNLLITSEDEIRISHRKGVLCRIFNCYIPVASYYKNDLPSQKIAAIQLVESGLANIKQAAEAVGLHRNTISTALRISQQLGVYYAIKDDRGCNKKAIHYTPRIKSRISQLLDTHPEYSDSEIAQEAMKELEIKVSRQAVARIRVEHLKPFTNSSIPTKQELMDMEATARQIDRKVRKSRQLTFNFENHQKLKTKVQKLKKEKLPECINIKENKTLSVLQKGITTPYAGLFFYHLFLSELNFNQLFEKIDLVNYKEYNALEIFLSIIFGIAHRLKSIEAHKLINPSQFGPLMGLLRSPDINTIRSCLEIVSNQNIANDLIDKFAIQILKIGAIDPKVFFIDGHFLPYYGLSIIAKGFYTTHNQTLKGNEIYVVSDIQKRPLMFITEGCEIDFRPTIERAVDRIMGYGIDRPIMVFDRGGYGIHFFSQLYKKADFITWGKYIKEDELNALADNKFISGIRFKGKCYEMAEVSKKIKESPATAKKEGREHITSINVRMIIIRLIINKKGIYQEHGKRLSVFTSNESLESWEIALCMLNRWGKSENFFKEIMSIYNFNYHPGYSSEEIENQPLFDNPKMKEIKAGIKVLTNEIKTIEGECAILKLKQQEKPKKMTITKIQNFESIIEQKIVDKKGLEEKLKKIPEKISLEELLGKPMNKCDLEKKRLYDLMQIISYHCRERLVEEFRQCYNRPQDLKQILDKILSKSGHIRLIGNTLIVLIDWIERPAHYKAALELCRQINRIGITIQGRIPMKIYFAISDYPII